MRFIQNGIAALCCLGALALAGCSLTASPADGLRFQAPPGWNSSPGMLGYVQFWRPPSGVREALMLFKSPKPISDKDFFSSTDMQGAFKSATVQSRSAIQICGNQPALFVQALGTSNKGEESKVEMVVSNVRGTSYLAMYLRPIDVAPNPMAEAALRELCAKS